MDPQIEIISEPGRYYVESAFTLSACIIGKKTIKKDNNVEKFYYVNDGTYGAFIEELLDIQHRIPNSLYRVSINCFLLIKFIILILISIKFEWTFNN